MVLAAILGVLVGVVSFLPLIGGTRLVRRTHAEPGAGQAGLLLLGVAGSLVVLIAAALICIFAFRPYALPFVVAEALALIVAAAVYGVMTMLRRGSRGKKE